MGLLTVLFASCDKDYDELGTDIVGDDHYLVDKLYPTITAHNQDVGPVASNGLLINPLGIYENPAFGTTKADFVTQLTLSSTSPTFNNTDPEKFVTLPTMDSVVMNIPYFSHVPKDAVITDNVKPYVLDSIYGKAESKFKLNIYRSNYYLRDLDPDQGLNEEQLFYTDNNVIGNNIDFASGVLNDASNTAENSEFFFNPKEHKTKTLDENNEPVYTRSAPSMRLHLNNQFFLDKIISTPKANLASQSAFKNYLRGLYFQVQSIGNEGNMAMLNFGNGEITLYYKEDLITPDNKTTKEDEYKVERVDKTFVLTLKGNAVSLQENSNMNAAYTSAINPANNTDPNGSEKLYVKGGQGSMAVIDIFSKTDVKKVVTNTTTGALELVDGTNGISDEIDQIKADGLLINEANLTFYVDRDIPDQLMDDDKTFEPNRIFLYDLNNNKMLVDYTYDFTSSSTYPKYNKYIYGGLLTDEDGKIVKQKNSDGTINKGTKYKIRITSHVRNLIKKDSTNVKLGLVVTENINSFAFSKRKTPITDGATIKSVPTMSVMNPLGTILHGTNPSIPDGKRLKLEIIYTKPKN
jgi:hypothetical protein